MQKRTLRTTALLLASALSLSACGSGLGILGLGNNSAAESFAVIPADAWANGATEVQTETVKADENIDFARRMGDFFLVGESLDKKTAKVKAFALENGKLKQIWENAIPKALLSQNQVFKHYALPAQLDKDEILDMRTGELIKTGWKNPFPQGQTLPMIYPLMAERVTDNPVYCEVNAFSRQQFEPHHLLSRYTQPEPYHCAAFKIGEPEAIWTFDREKAIAGLKTDEVLILDLQTGETEVKQAPPGTNEPELQHTVFFKDKLPAQFIPMKIGKHWVATDENFNFTEVTDESMSSQLKFSDACAVSESGLRTHKLYYNTADVQAISNNLGQVPDDGSTPVMCYNKEQNASGFFVPGKGFVKTGNLPFRPGYLLPAANRQVVSYVQDYDLLNSGCLYDVNTGKQLIEGRCELQYLMDPEHVVQLNGDKKTLTFKVYTPAK